VPRLYGGGSAAIRMVSGNMMAVVVARVAPHGMGGIPGPGSPRIWLVKFDCQYG